MKDLVVVQPKAISLHVKRSPIGSKRYTRIALISAILINVGTMFGLGVYIIENTPAPDVEPNTNQTEQKQAKSMPHDDTDELEMGPYISYSNKASEQKLTEASLDTTPDVQTVNGNTSVNGHLLPTDELGGESQSSPSLQPSQTDNADDKTDIAMNTTKPNEVETTHLLSVAEETKPTVESNPEQNENNGTTSLATMGTALAIMTIGKNTIADKPVSGEKTQAVPIIFSSPTPIPHSTQKRVSDTSRSQKKNAMQEQEDIGNVNDTKPTAPEEIHKLRRSLAMLGSDLHGNDGIILLKSPKTLLNTNDTLAIIVNSRNTQVIRNSDLRNYYTDKISEWESGQRISIYHLPLESTERAIFAQQILKMSAMEAATMESNRVITNRSVNPSITKVSKLVKAFVARNPRAIGYIPLADVADDPGIRVVMTLSQ